jgi:hypothetical protein
MMVATKHSYAPPRLRAFGTVRDALETELRPEIKDAIRQMVAKSRRTHDA